MNNDTEKFIQALKRVALDPREKRAVRERLLSEMRQSAGEHADASVGVFPLLRAVVTQWRMVAAWSFAVFLLAGSGVAFAAESALPGSPLYHVKTGVNETAVRLFSFGSRARRAGAELRILERRFAEAELLAGLPEAAEKQMERIRTLVSEQIERARIFAERADEEAAKTESVPSANTEDSSEVMRILLHALLAPRIAEARSLKIPADIDTAPSSVSVRNKKEVKTEPRGAKQNAKTFSEKLDAILLRHRPTLERLDIAPKRPVPASSWKEKGTEKKRR